MTTTPEQINAFLDHIRGACFVQDAGEGHYIIDGVIDVGKAIEAASASFDTEREFLASEARRYASHYPEASDGRNTFVIFAEMIERRSAGTP